jgi:hypothetical protein
VGKYIFNHNNIIKKIWFDLKMNLLRKLAPLALGGFLFFSPLSANSENPQIRKEQTHPYFGLSVSPYLGFSELGNLLELNKDAQVKTRINAGVNRDNFRIELGYNLVTQIAPFKIDSMGFDAICYQTFLLGDGPKCHVGAGLSLVSDLKDSSNQQISICPITTAGIDFPLGRKTNFYSDLSYRFIGMPLKLEGSKIIDQVSFSLDFGLRLGF